MGWFKKRKTEEVVAEPVQEIVTSGLSGQIVAAIAGAIAVICGEEAKILEIRPVAKRVVPTARSAWSMAGLLDNTRPF